MSKEAICAAIREHMAEVGVPPTEFDPDFAVKMIDFMCVSYFKYGRVPDAYPAKLDAFESMKPRLARYRQTGDKNMLVDVANFAMIEVMHPKPERNAHWGVNDASTSTGRVTTDKRVVSEDNGGTRIIGETILHRPDEAA